MSINNIQTANGNQVSNHANLGDVLKSVRVFEKGGFLHLDYRLEMSFRRNGKDRVRFSTGIAFSKRALAQTERQKYSLALDHYLKESTTVRDDPTLTLGAIALDAINEGRGNREEYINNDYLTIYENFIKPRFEKSILRDIKVFDVKAWKDDLLRKVNLSKARYIKYHRTLNFIFKFALENEYIDRNPMDFLDKQSKLFVKPKKNQDGKYYTATEVKLMLAHATDFLRVMLVTYLNTGIRTGEGLTLKWEDFDFEKNRIRIRRSIRKGRLKESTKTGEDRIILLSQPLKEELLTYREVCSSKEWLFPNPRTRQPYYEASTIVRKYFKPLLKKLDIEYRTFYALRHTFASLSMENNIPMSVIQKQLGHKKLSTTMDFYIKHDLLKNSESQDVFDNLYA